MKNTALFPEEAPKTYIGGLCSRLTFSSCFSELIPFGEVANVCRLCGVVVIDAHIRALMVKNCPRYQPKAAEDRAEEGEDDEPAEPDGGLNFEEFVKVFDEAKETAPKYTESLLNDALLS